MGIKRQLIGPLEMPVWETLSAVRVFVRSGLLLLAPLACQPLPLLLLPLLLYFFLRRCPAQLDAVAVVHDL